MRKRRRRTILILVFIASLALILGGWFGGTYYYHANIMDHIYYLRVPPGIADEWKHFPEHILERREYQFNGYDKNGIKARIKVDTDHFVLDKYLIHYETYARVHMTYGKVHDWNLIEKEDIPVRAMNAINKDYR